ncbi:Hint domain-containing protein [Tropicibacter naphthalenivorans]|uniref:Hom_end-associated Hint n=1 Tax=Tropicibacter naphthalenivorans TaxID=441103 RepID=A0A0P1G5W6_9RHOB|nr:Hint domain-containing protein [Tropicibacter naphthalenivorans]CUH77042.1 Hom_end-associated Hint [Tropicibacter naphthalenivorans]SMC61318.1 Hint domain-containing protein [Tropicibacter naphthalenivorans]
MALRDFQRPAQGLQVYRAEFLRVVNGANLGDPLGFAEELVHDDVYRLSPVAGATQLSVIATATPPFRIAQDSETGTPGADIHLDCCATFMSGDGHTTEVLVLVEVDGQGDVAQVYLLPLAPLSAKHDYVLVGVSQKLALQRFAQVACVSFTGGTMITMANGAQRPVEELEVGDRVLTRDDGPQEIRWIGHQTTRAVGAFAPICIREGTLNNTRDLVVSPDHRLFIYQRTDELGAGRSEILVRARHLVNGDTVTRLNGGFVDYYQMLFDAHQIIYAEGIAAESMLVDTRTRAALPEEIGDKLAELIPGHRKSDHRALEVQEGLLARPDAAALLRKSSGG